MCGACLKEPPAFDAAWAAVDYDFPWAGLVARLKFHDALDLCSALASLMTRVQRGRETALPDLLMPVPLSAQRLSSRGFNQAWELTRRLSRTLHLAADPRLVLRIRDTHQQMAVSPGRRHENVRGAFAVEPLRANGLQGRSVAFVDDVMTTGATAQELAMVARQAGARRVEIWVLARTPRPGNA
ncbi:ComF family protein [soil metagenome]